ncbi:MAG: UDP-N-acetylmuramate dehydrogenase, partial [FCB group bacterium]|nr:UDP-N-acetylmuramate dehydrogenase [FCB group bacterium]
GGALVMNAGAFGNEISEYLKQVRVLLHSGEEKVYEKRDMEFAYRESSFQDDELIISADFEFPAGDISKIKNRKERASLKRKKYQPLRYRSAGSIFKNPPSFAAGYLIDRVGLKGVRSGDAMISEQHANFIVNLGHATAENVLNLVRLARTKVSEQFDIKLELEVELLGFSPKLLASFGLV